VSEFYITYNVLCYLRSLSDDKLHIRRWQGRQ